MSNIIKVTSVIIGTIIGAGFISGQEIHSFFNKYGNCGQIGIIIAIGLIAVVIYKTGTIMYEQKIMNYEDFLERTIKSKNKIIIYTIKNIINIFLVISFFIMCSAFSTYCYENYQIPKVIGGMIISVASYIILKKDVKAIIKTNELLMPLIVIFIAIIGLSTIHLQNQPQLVENMLKPAIQGVLYANYNCIVLIPMLITLHEQIKNKRQIKSISIMSFLVMFILTEIIYTVQNKLQINNSEMPMLEVSKQISPLCTVIYGIMTGIAIFTSAISAAYSLTNNLRISSKVKNAVLLLLCIVAVPISLMSFSELVNLAYPIFGLLGIIQIIFILKP